MISTTDIGNKNSTTSTAKRIIWFLFVAFLLVAMFLNLHYVSTRDQATADGKENSEQNLNQLPPALALTSVALGPMRGLLTSMLWWRVFDLQQEGSYFEIMQLTEWITILQPKNPKVWSFQAFNMAFNISYELPDGDSKWTWIYRALKLLRGPGLEMNPGDELIRKELARIYWDKLGKTSDPRAQEFQKKWAYIMAMYLPEGTKSELESLAAAPDSVEKLRDIKEVSLLLEKAEKLELDLLNPKVFYNYEKWTQKQREVLANSSMKDAASRIDSFLRAQGLQEEQKLDPKRMLYIDNEYGPFDWRLFQGHVVYWRADGSFDDYLQKGINEVPMIRQAMLKSFLNGTLIFNPKSGIFVTTSNFKIIGKIHDYYDYMMEHHYSTIVDKQHRSFLEQAAAILYTFNKIEAAKEAFHHYKESYPEVGDDFERFIANGLYSTLHKQASLNKKVVLEGALVQAYNWLATGDIQRATGYANYAKLLWRRNRKKYRTRPSLLFPSFESFKKAAYNRVLGSDIAPEFKDRLLHGVVNKGLVDVDTGKVYLGETVENGIKVKRGVDNSDTSGAENSKVEEEERPMKRWFEQYVAILRSSFFHFLSDPFCLVLNIFIIIATLILASLPSFTFGEQVKLVRDEALAMLFICGCLASAIGASRLITDDIRKGIVSIVMSRPVSHSAFILGKWSGLSLGLGITCIISATSCLWATKMLSCRDLYMDMFTVGTYVFTVLAVLVLMTLKHYLFGGRFFMQLNFALCGTMLVVFFATNFLGASGELTSDYGALVDWSVLYAFAFVFMALLLFCALMILFAIFCDHSTLLGVCFIIFFFALLVGFFATFIPIPSLRTALLVLLPNWQMYWVANRIDLASSLSPVYICSSLFHAAGQVFIYLMCAVAIFRRRELSGAV